VFGAAVVAEGTDTTAAVAVAEEPGVADKAVVEAEVETVAGPAAAVVVVVAEQPAVAEPAVAGVVGPGAQVSWGNTPLLGTVIGNSVGQSHCSDSVGLNR
jgi:hypothetical protein